MRVLKSFLILILAAALTAGCFWIIDSYPGLFRGLFEKDESIIDVASGLTQRIYGLESEITDDELESLTEYETGLDKEIASYLKAHGGGKYTDSSGETHYVASSSGGGGYSGGGGGGYYYDDDDWSSGGGYSGGGGTYYDDGPGYTVDLDWDDTVYNYCQNCGTHYTGLGGCPNPDCEYYNP